MSGIAMKPRADDEVLLSILSRANSGESLGQISRSLGRQDSFARVAANRVLKADLAESGETHRAVLRGYGWA